MERVISKFLVNLVARPEHVWGTWPLTRLGEGLWQQRRLWPLLQLSHVCPHAKLLPKSSLVLRLCQVAFRQTIGFEILSVTREVTVNLLFLPLSSTRSWACSELSLLPVPRVRVWGLGKAYPSCPERGCS